MLPVVLVMYDVPVAVLPNVKPANTTLPLFVKLTDPLDVKATGPYELKGLVNDIVLPMKVVVAEELTVTAEVAVSVTLSLSETPVI